MASASEAIRGSRRKGLEFLVLWFSCVGPDLPRRPFLLFHFPKLSSTVRFFSEAARSESCVLWLWKVADFIVYTDYCSFSAIHIIGIGDGLMQACTRTIDEINAKLKAQEAIVVTADEFKQMVRKSEPLEQVDVVTTATMGIMSGTAALFCIPFAERGKHEKARKAWLNGVPAYPGPCPNERLGVVDLILYGTDHADQGYGGGHILRELVAGKEITLQIETKEGERVETSFRLNDLEFARIIGTRIGFKNYMAMVNSQDDAVKTIFSVEPLRGGLSEASVCGCGEINPLQNDPELKTMGMGTRILVNGGIGYIVGSGTRSSAKKPNISIVADMKGMDPRFMGGFKTSAGPECLTSIAIPIPVLNHDVLENLKVLDEDIPLPVAEIHSREPFAEATYAQVWRDTGLAVKFDPSKCNKLYELQEPCRVEALCPLDAFSRSKGIVADLCFHCGACVYHLCDQRAFSADFGSLRFDREDVSIVLRQSDKIKALTLAKSLKQRILSGEFMLTERVGEITF
jgi:putative methanogenesis marker 16 metalloprotein